MPTVFVVQEHKHDLTKAERFGGIKLLLPFRAQVWYDPAPHVAKLQAGLATATPEDYLVLMGDPALIGIATATLAQRTAGRFNLLKWSRHGDDYVAIPVNLKGEWSADEEDFLAQTTDGGRSSGFADE